MNKCHSKNCVYARNKLAKKYDIEADTYLCVNKNCDVDTEGICHSYKKKKRKF
jgi:hypothetical protein